MHYSSYYRDSLQKVSVSMPIAIGVIATNFNCKALIVWLQGRKEYQQLCMATLQGRRYS